jgi:hypothetical protein
LDCAILQEHLKNFMKKELKPYLGHFVRVFMDDFGVYKSQTNHFVKLEKKFQRFDEIGVILSTKKTRVAFSSRKVVE